MSAAPATMIYLDNNATTALDPEWSKLSAKLGEQPVNPSAAHRLGRNASKLLEESRSLFASRLGAAADEIIFTSGGTESNNAIIASAWTHARKTVRQRLVIGATEHPSVLEPARRWESEGGRVTRVGVDRHGVIRLEELEAVLQKNDTALVSIMWANNETGTIAPMQKIVWLAHHYGALAHSDAVQAIGKIPLNFRKVPVDYASISAHKFHGPHGVGALFVSKQALFNPWMLGGGQERGLRSGTENVTGIWTMMRAHNDCNIAAAIQPSPVAQMRDAFEQQVVSATGALVNGHPTQRLPNTTSVTFPDLDAAALLILLDERGVCCSAGSACHAASLHPSHVLEAMGLDARHASSTLRFSFSRLNTMAEAHEAAALVIEAVGKLRDLNAGGPVIVGS